MCYDLIKKIKFSWTTIKFNHYFCNRNIKKSFLNDRKIIKNS